VYINKAFTTLKRWFVCVCVCVCVYVLCVSMLLSMKCYSIIIQLQFAYNVLSLLLPLLKKDSTIKQLNLY